MYKHLKIWEHPENYCGECFPNWYPVYSKTRYADYITESNFQAILKRLGGESDMVMVAEFSHWAHNTVSTIMIRQDNTAALEIADACLEEIDQYPILDEDLASEIEADRAYNAWQDLSCRERIEILRDRNNFPNFNFRQLLSAVRGNYAPFGNNGYESYYYEY